MKTLEANIVRSFAEVRKEIDFLRDELKDLRKVVENGKRIVKKTTKKSRKVRK